MENKWQRGFHHHVPKFEVQIVFQIFANELREENGFQYSISYLDNKKVRRFVWRSSQLGEKWQT